jgi:hypothetical protein
VLYERRQNSASLRVNSASLRVLIDFLRTKPQDPCARGPDAVTSTKQTARESVRNVRSTSTPAVPFGQIGSFAATWGTGQSDPCSTIFALRGVGLAGCAPDVHVDAMLCIELDLFANAQSGAGEYGLG